MDAEYIRGFLRRKPFRPFLIRTSAGDTHKVSHLESIAFSPKGDLVILWPSEGGMALVDSNQITEAAYPARPRKSDQ